MYSKEELQAKSVVQLKDIAKELGVKVKSGDKKEAVVYAILDAQAEQPAPEAAPKRKRTRIATKKEVHLSPSALLSRLLPPDAF